MSLAAAPMAKFKVSKTRLKDFIVPLRHRVAHILEDTKNHVDFVMLPVLKDIDDNDRYFSIFLIAAQLAIVRVLIRKVDLYVVAARGEADGKPWIVLREKDGDHKDTLEFINQNIYKVPKHDGNGFLEPLMAPFRADYPSMEGRSKGREEIKLGRDELIQAICSIFKGNSKDVPSLATAFIVVAETISEALRFHSACDFINDRFYKKVGATPSRMIVQQQSEWAKFSEHLVRYAHDKRRNQFVLVGGEQVSTNDAKTIVALIKGFSIEELDGDESYGDGECSNPKYKKEKKKKK